MTEEDGMTLNIVSGAKVKKKKRNPVFYGVNNYRMKKNLNSKTRKLLKWRLRNRPIKKLNTASIKISATNTKEKGMQGSLEGSTALHFRSSKAVPKETSSSKRIVPVAEKNKDKKQTSNKPKTENDDANSNQVSVPQKLTGGKVTWKSSLFNQNPEIPKLQQPGLVKIKEDMFSSVLFTDLDIHPHLISFINQKLDLKHVTAIQQKCIPVLLSGKDALVKSQTGSGKTLSYAIPVVQKIQEMSPEVTRKDGPVALVLVPTRELALQSFGVFSKLTLPFCRIVPTWIIGGENRKSEKSRIRKGVNIIVGTPGRVLDHIQTTKSLVLNNLRWLVFDEADRLLDMGFQKQVDAILKTVSEQQVHDRQTVLLSATLSEKVERLANLALQDPVRVLASNDDSSYESDEKEENFAIPENLEQRIAIVPSKLRLVCLVTFLQGTFLHNPSCKMIAFLSCRDSVEFHYHLLKRVMRQSITVPGFSIPLNVDVDDSETECVQLFQLHGGMSQSERQSVFKTFVSAKSGILLGTDVAARGLDLPLVDWVVQYTSPGSPVDYIHRVGRTARAGRGGRALLMLTPAEAKYVTLLTQYNIKVKEMMVDDILVMAVQHHGGTDHDPRTVKAAKDTATSLQGRMELHIAKNKKIRTQATTAYASFIRAYATYPTALKSIFHVKHLHLGHVAKSFALQEAPGDIVKTLQKSVGHLPVRTSFEHREAKKAESSSKDEVPKTSSDDADAKTDDSETKPRPPQHMSRRERVKRKMARKPDLMSEFSSGLGVAVPTKKLKK